MSEIDFRQKMDGHATVSPYQADFPALFVEWATQKIEAECERLEKDASLTDAQRLQIEHDISYFTGAIERIAGGDIAGLAAEAGA